MTLFEVELQKERDEHNKRIDEAIKILREEYQIIDNEMAKTLRRDGWKPHRLCNSDNRVKGKCMHITHVCTQRDLGMNDDPLSYHLGHSEKGRLLGYTHNEEFESVDGRTLEDVLLFLETPVGTYYDEKFEDKLNHLRKGYSVEDQADGFKR